MDLTRNYPRSMKEKIAGIAGLARLLDKAKAKTHGNLGDYTIDRPMDTAVFDFLGIDVTQLLDVVERSSGDAEVHACLETLAEGKSETEIERFNQWFLHAGPAPGSDLERSFYALRDAVAPDRSDVTAWADLLDLDEGRDVVRGAAPRV